MTDSRGATLPVPVSPLAAPLTATTSEYTVEFEERWSVWRARGVVEAQRTRQLATAGLIVVGVIAAVAVARVFLAAN